MSMPNETAQEQSLLRKWTGRVIEGVKGGSSMQTRFQVLNLKKLSEETVAGIQDMTMGKIKNGYRSGLHILQATYIRMSMPNETAQEESLARKWTGRVIEGVKGGSSMQTRFQVLNLKKLSKETVAGIQDMTMGKIKNGYRSGLHILQAKYIRMSKPNDIPQEESYRSDPNGFLNRKNPHIGVSQGVFHSAKVLNSTLKYAGVALTVASVAVETWRIGCAIRDDKFVNEHANEIIQELEDAIKKLKETFEGENNLERKKNIKDSIEKMETILKDVKRTKKAPVQTIKTTASAVGGWSGGFAAGGGGAWAGASTGATIGSLFGPVGVAVGAPIGAVVGAIGLGIAGGIVGSTLGENVAEAGLTLLDD
ncbi:uncharacterized protein LOC143365163 isoform X1 [Halictus rubicundus]|uniref:uncharacterized protein LOC143365163 isoform X1 n=1 Tax=Halictus rubicundus TaxID=77578 RepID=UPI0040374CEC